jgi:di/tricarboxylate transporter
MAIVVVVFALTTTVMTNLITNAAAASILTPVALGIATRLGLNPVTLLALVGTCISFTFINPFSHQSNLVVMGPAPTAPGRSRSSAPPSWSCRWQR